jgi:hypothetical protein
MHGLALCGEEEEIWSLPSVGQSEPLMARVKGIVVSNLWNLPTKRVKGP